MALLFVAQAAKHVLVSPGSRLQMAIHAAQKLGQGIPQFELPPGPAFEQYAFDGPAVARYMLRQASELVPLAVHPASVQ